MSLPNWLSWCSNGGRASLLKLYIIAVVAVRVWGEYYLSNFVVVLNGPKTDPPKEQPRFGVNYYKGYTRSEASAIINAKDAFAGICGFIGAILLDVYLTDYGLIFFSSLIYGVGLLFIMSGLNFISPANFLVAIIGLFMSGAGNISLMNSSHNLAEAKRDSNHNNPNILTNFIQYAFGTNTEIYRQVHANGSAIVLLLIKYATKVTFIVFDIVLDYLTKYAPAIEFYMDYASFAKLLIPTIGLLLMALVSLVHVKTFVKPANNRGTPLKVVIRVCVAAFRKRHLDVPVEGLHEGSPEHPLAHTNGRLRFLDKAAIVAEEDRGKQRVCTVTEVEETKCLFRMVPMCTCFLLYGLVSSVGTTLFLLQGNEMDATLGSSDLQVPLQTLIIFGEISGLVTKFLYVRLISKRLSEPVKMYASLIKYDIGIVLATFCCTIASWMGTDKGPEDSVFWLTPQFVLFGAMNELTRDGIQSFFQDRLPPSLKSYHLVFTDTIIGVGAGLCAALVYADHYNIDRDVKYYGMREPGDYYPELYPSRNLGIFYRLLSVVCFVILSAYTFVAIMYRFQEKKDAQLVQESP